MRHHLLPSERAERNELGDHAAGFVLVMLVLVAANAATPGYPWVLWPLAAWGALLIGHALIVYRHTHGDGGGRGYRRASSRRAASM